MTPKEIEEHKTAQRVQAVANLRSATAVGVEEDRWNVQLSVPDAVAVLAEIDRLQALSVKRELPTAQTAPKILIVEDDPDLSKAMERFFRRHLNAVSDVIETAETAMLILSTGAAYDAVISDWNLAGTMKGDAVFAAVKELGLDDKFVFFTSEEEKARKLHHAVVTKPSAMDALVALVRVAIEAKAKPQPNLVAVEQP